MDIVEQFDSIQGEGTLSGVPMSFIRLHGCNLNCIWCDTRYANSEYKITSNIEEIVDLVKKEWVCITGGEPLVQSESLPSLLLLLKSRYKKVEIETNGSIPPPAWAFFDIITPDEVRIPLVDSWVVDIKLPSSGNPSSTKIIRRWSLASRESDQIKFVVSGDDDLQTIEREWLGRLQDQSCKATLLISPVMRLDGDTNKEALDKVVRFGIESNLRVSLQLHKIIWGNKKGV